MAGGFGETSITCMTTSPFDVKHAGAGTAR